MKRLINSLLTFCILCTEPFVQAQYECFNPTGAAEQGQLAIKITGMNPTTLHRYGLLRLI